MAASAASVPAATLSNASDRDSASTACHTPKRTRIAATLRPRARARTASSTPSQTPYSCMPELVPGRAGQRLQGGLALGRQPADLGGGPYLPGRVEGLLHALPSLARADPVAEGESDDRLHAVHIPSRPGVFTFAGFPDIA